MNQEQPIRIAQVVGKMLGGGVEAVVMNYYRHIDRSKVQFDFLVDSDSTLVPSEQIESLGGRVFEIPPYQHPITYQSYLQDLFEREGWKIVHSHINALSVFPLYAAKQAGVPIRIAHSHSMSGKGEFVKNSIKYLLKTQSNRYATHRFCCSEEAGLWLFGPKNHYDVIRNAIQIEDYLFSREKREIIRRQLGISDNAFVIGHIGRFAKQKNQQFLLKAFYQASSIRKDLILILVGEGSTRQSCEAWCAEHGLRNNVMFLGQREDVDSLYSAFDLFAFPSLYEGLGIVAIEAQVAGLPCLVSPAVPREAKLSTSLKYLDIDSTKKWTAAFLEVDKPPSRVININDFAQYDIRKASSLLCTKYFSLLSDLRSPNDN